MAKIFDVQDWLKNHPNRNNFDLTHKVHGSYQFGKLYPVLCKPVVPTDSFRIDTAVSLRFTPMPFPTQSNMRVIFHYFYVRNKNIWKNWSNWLQGLEEHTPPFIAKDASFYKDGSLADHLGIQTSFLSGSSSIEYDFQGSFLSGESSATNNHFPIVNFPSYPFKIDTSSNYVDSFFFTPISTIAADTHFSVPVVSGTWIQGLETSFFVPIKLKTIPRYFSFEGSLLTSDQAIVYNTDGVLEVAFFDTLPGIGSSNSKRPVGFAYYSLEDSKYSLVTSSWGSNIEDNFVFDSPLFAVLCFPLICTYPIDLSRDDYFGSPLAFSSFKYSMISQPSHHELGDEGIICPYASNVLETSKIRVSALPFRAYESIYNAFYRNSQGVQPFQINGVTQYNKYVTNDGDGADSTNYALFERNWELDAYTSCLISPQQGNVPYVGITDISALGRMHVETPEGDSAEVRLIDNGDGVEISNLRGDTPEARSYALRAASSGFTIPEFREANALQRFLEMNIRKGYKYIDFIEGHFGKKPTYSEMDMPEFIGGFSQRISVNEISNTNGVDNDTLGAIAGQARAIGGSKHGINHYFDDFGFVVGIMCIVPDNAYDSILPKHFNLKNPLDCYFPEFSQLSYMPLTHEELAPLQTINDPRGSAFQNLSKVFGYQRPNHDLVWYPDTVHGLFRDASGIGNSVICRRFAFRPELSDSFLRIKPEETDTIFNYTFGDNDIALGEIVFSINAKRPIPRLVVPTIS